MRRSSQHADRDQDRIVCHATTCVHVCARACKQSVHAFIERLQRLPHHRCGTFQNGGHRHNKLVHNSFVFGATVGSNPNRRTSLGPNIPSNLVHNLASNIPSNLASNLASNVPSNLPSNLASNLRSTLPFVWADLAGHAQGTSSADADVPYHCRAMPGHLTCQRRGLGTRRNAYGHVYRHVCRHVYRHWYAHVDRHVHRYGCGIVG